MAIARVQFNSNSAIASTTVVVTMGSTPTNANFMVAMIGSVTAVNAVTSITQTGATWVQAVESVNAGGITYEIWYAENISGASTTVTVNLALALTCTAIVAEYSSVKTSSSLDKTATNTGDQTTNPDTGTTATTAQANELWIGGYAIDGSSPVFEPPSNGFSEISEVSTTGLNISFEEKIVSTTGAANTSSATNPHGFSETWAGAIATFKDTTPGGGRRIIVI